MNIILTGASSGIGYQTVLELAITGAHNIILISRNEAALQKLQKEVDNISKSTAYVVVFDLSVNNFTELLEKIDAILNFKKNNFVDILINNAGYLVNSSFTDIAMDEWQRTFDVNLFSTVKIIKMLFPYFNRMDSSHIVNIASMGGVQGTNKFDGLSAYSASKGAVNILTESLATEFINENIKVNAINPGAVQTEMLEEAFPGYKAPVTPQQMGNYIANFALTAHKLMNGRIVEVSMSN